MNEFKKHDLGVGLMLGGIPFILLACFVSSGFIGMIGIIAFVVGFFLVMGNESESHANQRKNDAQRMADLMAMGVKHGYKPTSTDIDALASAVSGVDISRQKQRQNTKEIIKGAAIGGVVAGDVGAIIGAEIAKEKLKNKQL